MELIPIHTAAPYYAEAEQLMAEAFPPEERRPAGQQREYADRHPLFHPHAVTENGRFAGLVNYWQLDGFLYLEHLATCPSVRGGGLGRRILEQVCTQAAQPIVLEVEPPASGIAARRIGFYRRCGFTLWQKRAYLQPPYAPHLPAVRLMLMACGDIDEDKDFDRVVREIHTRIYGLDNPLDPIND